MTAKDRGKRGLVYEDQAVRVGKGAYLEPLRGGTFAFEDFLFDTVAENSSVTITQSGTPATAAAVGTAAGPHSGHGGWLAGAVQNVDAEIDEIALGAKPWILVSRATTNALAVCEVGFVVPTALTARQYYIGFTDDETEGTGTNGALNIQTGTTLVSVAADAAGFIMSSLATDADGYYYSAVNGNTDKAVTSSGLTAVVDDYTILRVEVDASGDAFFYGAISAASIPTELSYLGGVGTAVATTAVLIPMFSAAATTTTAVTWEIDYMFGASPR
jgi:hypothetical protein